MKKADEFRIGLWTIISIVVLVFGIKYLKGQLHTTTTYYMIATNVEGLAESSHVKIEGFKVGFVRSMDYDYKHGQVVVELNIDPELHIPTDSRALISADLLNASNIIIELGNSTQYLHAGDTIFGGGVKPGLLDAAGPMLSSVTDLLPKIDSLLTGVNRIVADSKINETLLEINRLSLQLHRTLGELNRQLPQILTQVNDATANLDTLSISLKEAEIAQIINNANTTICHVDSLLTAISSTDGTTGKLISTDELHEQLISTIADVDSLVTDIKENPKRYINIKLFGK